MKPRMFIGSSSEHLPTAKELGSLLEADANIIHWDGVLRAGQFTIEGLFDAASRVDFALFVFAPDDILYSRDKQYWATRDNVIFELGLFMGRLGREHAFLVVPEVEGHKMLSDLLGLTYVSYRTEGPYWSESLKRCAEKITSALRANAMVSHTGWNELSWLRNQLRLQPASNSASALDVVAEACADRKQPWRDGDFDELMGAIQKRHGFAVANTVHFILFWCGGVIPRRPHQPNWYDDTGNRWIHFAPYVRLSDRGLILLNQLRNP